MSGPSPNPTRCPCCGQNVTPLPYKGFGGIPLPTCPKCGRIVSGEHQGKLLRVSPIGVAYWHADEAFERGTPAQRQLLLFAPPPPGETGGVR